MAELLLKRKKGNDQPPAEVFELQIEPTLVFQTAHEAEPFVVDLTLFAHGITAAEVAQRKGAGRLLLPFSGRPKLIHELLPHIHEALMFATRLTCTALTSSLKWWWRLLDSCQGYAPVTCIADFDPIHYATYRVNPCSATSASRFFSLVDSARAAKRLSALHWTAISRPGKPVDLVAHEDVAKLYTYFQQKCKTILIGYELDDSELPCRQDIHTLYIMFIILTGWNPSVVINIDVSRTNPDGTLACITPDIQNPLYSVISSIKIRAGETVQQAHGLNKQRISCINIVKALHRQTASLRSQLHQELSQLVEMREKARKHEITLIKADADILTRKIADLQAKIRCPWIYSGQSDRISMLSYPDVVGGKKRPLEAAITSINSQLPSGATPIANGITLTDFRDAFISFRWHKGGYSWLATMMAAGHSSLASLSAYLNKRQHHQASQVAFLKVTTSTWKTIDDLPSKGSAQMPIVVAARVGGISEDSLSRWLLGKDITIQGVGCRDPKNPPQSIAPSHEPGSSCRPQRCLLCHEHAVLLPDSYIYIAKRLAELHYIQLTMSVLAWVESDYAQETSNATSALALYDNAQANKALEFWKKEIEAGRHIPMRMEGTYA